MTKTKKLVRLKNVITEHGLQFSFPSDLSIFAEKKWPLYIYYNDMIRGERYPIEVPFECVKYVSETLCPYLNYLDMLSTCTAEDIWLSENPVENVQIAEDTISHLLNFYSGRIKEDHRIVPSKDLVEESKLQKRKSPIMSPNQIKRDKIKATFLRGIFEDLHQLKDDLKLQEELNKKIPKLMGILNNLESGNVEYLFDQDKATTYILDYMIKSSGPNIAHGLGKNTIESVLQELKYMFLKKTVLDFSPENKD